MTHQTTITPDPDGNGVILHLPEITHLDTQVWSADVGLTAENLIAGLRLAAAAVSAAVTPPTQAADEAALAPLKAKARELEARRLAEHRAAVLREAADALDAGMERFFGEWPDEPRNSPYALGQRDAANELRRMADEGPLSPYYEHPECGFHWHGRDGMDIPMRDGQPVCPRCELAKVQKRLDYTQRLRDEVGVECKRRGKRVLEQSERIIALERQVDEVQRQLGAEILRAGQAEAELRRMADETATETPHTCKPGASTYYCPTSGETESDCHGGFTTCCDRPDLHQPDAGARQDGAES